MIYPKKKQAIKAIDDYLKSIKYDLNSTATQNILNNFHKAIFKCFSDNVEVVRETSVKIMQELISRCEDITQYLPYLCEILVDRINCQDLEGILHLPEVMRPPPSQSPHVHTMLKETVEEIRMEYCELLSVVISCSSDREIREFIPDICNILRALAMDPCGEVQIRACRNISQLCKAFTALLLHFTEMLARAVLLPLVNKKSKVRIAAIEALGSILYCGIWKFNVNVMEIMIGFRDPNVVPLRDFFEYSTRINYFASLIKDPKTSVRDFFIRTLGDWLISLPDKVDHEGRLAPYMVSGLFDLDEEVRQTAYELIEEIGVQYEREKEKEFREIKQFGVEPEWTSGGKITQIQLFPPFKKRPRLGARVFVRSHIRKYLSALYKDVKDWQFENRIHSANLLLVSLIYCEDFIAQYIDKFFVNLLQALTVKDKEDKLIYDVICRILFYLGAFCSYKSFYPIITAALKGELTDVTDIVDNVFVALPHLIKGYFEVTTPDVGISQKKEFIYQLLDLLSDDSCLNNIDKKNYESFDQILESILNGMLTKTSKSDIEEFVKLKREQIHKIYYTVLGMSLQDKLQEMSGKDETKTYAIEFASFITNHMLSKLHSTFQQYDDLDDYSYINSFHASLTSYHLNSIQWKILVGIFLKSISESETKGREIITMKVLTILRDVDLSNYSKASDVILINIGLIRVTLEKYLESKCSTSESAHIVSMSFQLISNVLNVLTEQKVKFKDIHDKFIKLFKYTFSRHINYSVIASNLDENKKSEFITAISDIIYHYTILMKDNANKKEFKLSVQSFKTLISYLTPELSSKTSQFMTSKKKYIIPDIFEFAMSQSELLNGDDEFQLLPLMFQIMIDLSSLIPEKLEFYNGQSYTVTDYPTFIKRLITLHLDTKDSDVKFSIKIILKKLKLKTPDNWLKELERALKDKNLSKMELLQSLE
jgi:hypothetical protein